MHLKESLEFHGRTLSIETGRVAKQADGSVWIQCGDAVLLVTAVSAREARKDQDWFPLTCDYTEKTYSAGKIPGGYFKREGRPTETEVLTSRMIDRPIRPLFPAGYMMETQVIATMMSFDPDVDPSTLAIVGASAALHVSDIPFSGPLGAVRVGRIEDEWIINPSFDQLDESDVNVLVAATREGIVMVEGGAYYIPEAELVEALMLAQEAIQPLLDLQDKMRAALGVTARTFTRPELDADIAKALEDAASPLYNEAQRIVIKQDRYKAYDEAKAAVFEQVEVPDAQMRLAKAFLGDLKKKLIRQWMSAEQVRIDRRAFDEVRPIACETDVLPRAHGSALFTRGETQVLAALTLGTSSDEQRLDTLLGDITRRVLLHYNFPPFSVGEARFLRGPSRRDIGHGNLALTGLMPSLPSQEDFPYTIRLVAEVLESNGSSSMATVCSSSLAMMAGGVPVTTATAGIAMGLLKEGDDIIVLTDILGDEDHYGDMDFKVVGNAEGISAIQMDIKIESIDRDILLRALAQARDARLHILERMASSLSEPRGEMSPFAPQITTLKIPVDRIRYLIGPGGKYIRGITEETGAVVNVEDDGTVQVAATGQASMDAAIAMVKEVGGEVEVGVVYTGRVTKTTDFGAFVALMPGMEGLLHISEMSNERVEDVESVVNMDDEVQVKVLAYDKATNKIRLSMRDLTPGISEEEQQRLRPPDRGRRDRNDRGGRGGDRGGRGGDRGGRGPRRD